MLAGGQPPCIKKALWNIGGVHDLINELLLGVVMKNNVVAFLCDVLASMPSTCQHFPLSPQEETQGIHHTQTHQIHDGGGIEGGWGAGAARKGQLEGPDVCGITARKSEAEVPHALG